MWQSSTALRRSNTCRWRTDAPEEVTMDLKLTDKRALVSGSTKGIGLAIATALAREGARVVINGRTEASVSAALSEIRGSEPNATIEGFAGDLATPQAAELLGTQSKGQSKGVRTRFSALPLVAPVTGPGRGAIVP